MRKRFLTSGLVIVGLASALSAGSALWAETGDSEGSGLFSFDAPPSDLQAGAAFAVDSVTSPLGAILGQADSTESGRTFGFKAGIGFTADPGTFLLAFQGDYALTPHFALGTIFQFGFSDRKFLFAPTVDLRASFSLPPDDGWDRLVPFVHMGLGLAYLDWEGIKGDDGDVAFLLNPGIGFEFFVTDYFALGTDLMFNILPTGLHDDHFFVSWQVLTFRFQF